ncbi:MAG: MBL fold metallo-hydrolase [Candidatus Amulumruptor caecigallinarius]|nr:MBL fold metallo-hydrolase [Candidatus Amulumruptor caecigallinarius]
MKIAKFCFSLFGINSYVVWDSDTLKCVVIDPGMFNSQEQEALSNFIKRNNLKVEAIVNTHLHIDHAVGNKYVSTAFGATIKAHPADEWLGQSMREQARMFGIPERVDNVTISSHLEDGDIIKVGNGVLEVLHVPGHSPGSIALYDRADGFVVTGDALFADSIGRTDLPGGNMHELLNSIRTKLFTLPDNTVVYPGHGPETTIGYEKLHNAFLRK